MNQRHAVAIAIGVHAVLMLTAYFGLVTVFDFPDILREPPEVMLAAFRDHRTLVTGFYAAFMWSQIAFIVVVLAMRERFAETATSWLRPATHLGVLAGLAQAIGFSRWPFVVGGLADRVETMPDATLTVLDSLHQFAGVAVGEHLFFCFEALWVLALAAHLLARPEGSHVSRAGSLVLVPIGVSIGIYALEQLGGPFAALGPLNVIAHGALLFWLVGFAIRQVRDRGLKVWEVGGLILAWAVIVFGG